MELIFSKDKKPIFLKTNEMLLSAQEMIRAECTEMCAVPKWDYTEECYQDAGISDILKKRNAQSFWESQKGEA